MERISLDVTLMFGRTESWALDPQDLLPLIPIVEQAHKGLMSGEGDIQDRGIPMTGWLTLPFMIDASHLKAIMEHARGLAEKIDAFVSIGIGGSYLGIESTIRALSHSHYNQLSKRERNGYPEIYFLGTNMDPDFFQETLDLLKGKRVGLNVISKSGTTIETALAFRLLRKILGWPQKGDMKDLLVISTDAKKGGLRAFANRYGIESYEIPEDVGGRFSVLTDPLLFSIAMAGIDLVDFWKGFLSMAELTSIHDFWNNMAMVHALMRYMAWRLGKQIEVVATNSYHLCPIARWMEQLFPESEGHNGKGLWVSPSLYTEKLHANGQMVQEGPRNMMETFLILDRHQNEIPIPRDEEDLDGLNFLFSRQAPELGEINRIAHEATALAHYQGGVPNMTLHIPRISPFFIGQLYFLMEKSVALSGYLLGHNPFIQPGVEAYKKNMYALLGRPGTEDQIARLRDIRRSLKEIRI